MEQFSESVMAKREECYEPTVKQIEDWHVNYCLKKKQPGKIMKLEIPLNNIRIEVFKEVYKYLVLRHQSLRSYFPKIGNNIIQRIDDYSYTKFGITFIKAGVNSNLIKKKYASELRNLKNLQNGPLIKAILIQIQDDKY